MQPFTNHSPVENGHAPVNGSRPSTPPPAPSTAPERLDDRSSDVVLTDVVEVGHLRPVLARRTLQLTTERAFHVTDVTDHCLALLADSGVRDGSLSVFSGHTTCAVKINERETCFLEDLRLFMEKLVPAQAYYRHDDFEMRDPRTLAGAPEEEPLNGHSHIKQMLLGSASETVPVADGALRLGRWQRIMFIELDQARRRRVDLQVQGWS